MRHYGLLLLAFVGGCNAGVRYEGNTLMAWARYDGHVGAAALVEHGVACATGHIEREALWGCIRTKEIESSEGR